MPNKKKNWYNLLSNIFLDKSKIISINNIAFNNIDLNNIVVRDIVEYKCQNTNCENTHKKQIRLFNDNHYCKLCLKKYKQKKIL